MVVAQGRWLPVTAAQRRHAQAGREAAEADWAAAAIKISDELIGTNPYYRAAYCVRHHELLEAERPPVALPAGFAASPNLTGITFRASCSVTPGCTLDTPCQACQDMLTEATAAAELAIAASAGHTVWCSDCSKADPCESCRAILADRTDPYGSHETDVTPDRNPGQADDASEPCSECGGGHEQEYVGPPPVCQLIPHALWCSKNVAAKAAGTALPKPQTRHLCSNVGKVSHPHSTNKAGKPRRANCGYCGSAWRIITGWWGVFTWNGRGDYRLADAHEVHSNDAKAERALARLQDGTMVIRWIDEPSTR